MTMLDKVKQAARRLMDDAFVKVFGLAEGGTALNVRVKMEDPERVAEVFRRDIDKRLARERGIDQGLRELDKQHLVQGSWGRGDLPKVPPYPNLANAQIDAKAAKSARAAVRLATDWALGFPADGEGYLGDALTQARRQARFAMEHLKFTGRFTPEFAPGEENVYVALVDLMDIETNGLDRAHARVRSQLEIERWKKDRSHVDWDKVKSNYEKLDVQANSDWQECLEDRRLKLRASVIALTGAKKTEAISA